MAELFQRQAAHGETVFLFRRHLSKRSLTAQGLKDRVPAKAVGPTRSLGDNTRDYPRKDAALCPVVGSKERGRCNRPVGFAAQQFTDSLCSQSRQKPLDQRPRQPVPGGKGQAGVFDQHRPAKVSIGLPGLMGDHWLEVDCLDLFQRHSCPREGSTEDALDLGQFVRTAGDEGEQEALTLTLSHRVGEGIEKKRPCHEVSSLARKAGEGRGEGLSF